MSLFERVWMNIYMVMENNTYRERRTVVCAENKEDALRIVKGQFEGDDLWAERWKYDAWTVSVPIAKLIGKAVDGLHSGILASGDDECLQ